MSTPWFAIYAKITILHLKILKANRLKDNIVTFHIFLIFK